MSFEELGLSEKLMKAINDCGYTEPTPIQAAAIPPVLMTRDLIGVAQTGTGKTAGFTLPMIEILSSGRAKARMPRSLVLAPTRELAAQVAENFDTYGKYLKLNKALLVGGESVSEQKRQLEKGVDVLIATPGRLLDLFERGAILLNDIKIVVIDEADRMLDMGFIPDIEKIFTFLPNTRQTLLFSATMPDAIRKLADKFLQNPKHVSVAPPASAAKTVEQFIFRTDQRQKMKVIKQLVEDEGVKNAFIFCNRKKDVDAVAKWLEGQGLSAEALHGDMPQKSRYEKLDAFKAGDIRLLVCSDVAARGLDVEAVSHVFNYDIPMNADDYVHRIGRTGRAGMKGRAFSLVGKNDEKFLDAVEELLGVPFVDISKGKPQQDHKKTDHKKQDHKKENYKKPDQKKEASPSNTDKKRNNDSQKTKPKPAQHKTKQERANEPQRSVVGFGDDLPNFLK